MRYGETETESASKPESKRLFIGISSVIVAVTVISSILFVYYSPDYSWSSSIRDNDGDGHPDAKDVFPNDPVEWQDSDGDGVGDNSDPLPNGLQDGEFPLTFSAALIWNGFGAVCTVSETSISWENVTVVLSDGASNASWSAIEDTDFSGYPYVIADCGAVHLGTWNVTLLAWDMQPNQALDAEDHFSFLFGEPLPKSVEYFVTVVYEPTNEVLAEFSYIELS